MNLYYTVVSGYNAEQPNPDRSLGGYKSSTPVVNDDFSNIFDELSVMTMRNNRDEYRAIILRNDYTNAVANVKIKISVPEDAICTYKLAVVPMNGVNKYGQKFMESVMTVNSKPFHAQFTDMNPDTVVSVGRMEIGDEIGIWICRHIDGAKARAQFNEVCEPDPTDPTGRRYRSITHPKEEKIDMIITWT